MYNVQKLNKVKLSCLVLDIETSAFYPDGREVSIKNFEDYLEHAECKFFGAYSYRDEQMYLLNARENTSLIESLLSSHDTIVGFNSDEFDFPILKNNLYTEDKKRYLQVDCMTILGTSNFSNKKGFAYKNRGALMGHKFKNNKLRTIAEIMGLSVQKGDIDYKIFQKDEWTEDELKEIYKYLEADVLATKEMFDELWAYWIPFVEMLDEKSVYDLTWIRASIASLTYRCACNAMNVAPTYGEYSGAKEEMGGRVIMPKYEEARKVWYVDFASLYPHIFCMFNLFAEEDPELEDNLWHGNKVFQVKGHYNISALHTLSTSVAEKLVERINLKDTDPDDPMIYTIKIFLNGLYGVARSAIFEQVGGDNCGWDCCWLGQQIHELTEQMMNSFGFETIGGDTDSVFLIARDEADNNREYVKECLEQIIDVIRDNVPFSLDTFKIDIEAYIDYILFPFSEQPVVDAETVKYLNTYDTLKDCLDPKAEKILARYKQETQDKKKVILDTEANKIVKNGRSWVKERQGKKKNYLYLYNNGKKDKIELVGLPIKKDNATKLGIQIYEKVLKPIILETKQAKFTKEKIDKVINIYLEKPEVMSLVSREYKVKAHSTYANSSQIQGQISKHYFDGDEGVIDLVKNFKIGEVGKGSKYCTVQEAIDAKLNADDLDLDKLYNELDPFIIFVPKPPKVKVKKATKKKVVKKLEVKAKIVKREQEKSFAEKKETTLDKSKKDVLYFKKEEKKTDDVDGTIDWD